MIFWHLLNHRWRHGPRINLAVRAFIALLFYTFLTPLSAAESHNDAALLKQASQTMGYYLGQTESLKVIVELHPSLEKQALIAQRKFDSEFGVAIGRIDSLLSEKIPDIWVESKSDLITRIRQTNDDWHSAEKAQLFISEVAKRANGNIESPFLETLLNFKYHESQQPELEFGDGYTLRYRNNGTDKAKGVAFSIKYPRSWSSLEASRPNIARKFTSENGAGNELFMILIKNLGLEPGISITKDDVSDFIADGGILEMLPGRALYEDGGKLTIEGLPGFWMTYSLDATRLRTSIRTNVIAYTIYMDSTMIQLQGHVVTHIDGEPVENGGLPRFQHLFDQMANSLVIESLY